jgi:methyl-accepting chemotaxis protein
MSLKKKLLALVILPVIICSAIAIIISTVKIKNQGINGLEDKSNAILSLNIDQFMKYHEDGGEIEVQKIDELYNESDTANDFIFRISTLDPINDEHLATEKEKEFIDRFINEDLEEIAHEDDEANLFWVMRPVYMDEKRGCLECHEVDKSEQTSHDFRGMFVVVSKMDEVKSEVRSSIFQISFVSIIIVLISIVVGFFIIRIIINSIKKIISVSQKVSEGDLKQKVDINTNDELEELGSYINVMIDSLNSILLEVTETAQDMAKANKELTETSKVITSGTQNQATQYEELTSALHSTTENTQGATDFINQSVKDADIAEEKMNSVVEEMNKIESSSINISQSIKIINEISAKIKMLSLNAAIEAARAGVHGKGFAVVANEVKKLSELTSESTKSINIATKESSSQISEGVKIAADAGAKIKEIINAISEIAASLKEILEATREQSSIMDKNNKIINTNATVAENLRDAALSLDNKANALLEMTERFKLKK